MASVRYMVADVDQAVDFYTRHLGFALDERWGPALAIVSRDDLRLWLSGPQTSAARPMPDGRVPAPGGCPAGFVPAGWRTGGTKPPGWNRFVIEVTDIQTLAGSLTSAGVTFRNEIISGPGGSQVLIEDPSGNPIELFQVA